MLYGLLKDEGSAVVTENRKRKNKDSKEGKRKEGNAPSIDRIPLPSLPFTVLQERKQYQREALRKGRIGVDSPPSICLYTVLNAAGGTCCASFSENVEMAAVGYGSSLLQVHAIGQKAFRRLKNAEDLDTLDNETDEMNDDVYDDASRETVLDLNGHLGSVYSVSFSCDRRLLLSSSQDATVRLWNLDLRRNIVVYRMDGPVWCSQFCNRGMYFAASTSSKCVSLFSTERIHPIRIFTDVADDVTTLDFHPNCNYIAGGGDDNQIRIWDVSTANCVQTLTGHSGIVHSVKVCISQLLYFKFSPDGRTLVSASDDGTLCVWDIGMQKMLAVQECGSMPQHVPIVFSRDSSVIAVGTPDSAVTFFNVDSVTATSALYGPETRMDPEGFPLFSYTTRKTNFLDFHFSRKNIVMGIGAYDQ